METSQVPMACICSDFFLEISQIAIHIRKFETYVCQNSTSDSPIHCNFTSNSVRWNSKFELLECVGVASHAHEGLSSWVVFICFDMAGGGGGGGGVCPGEYTSPCPKQCYHNQSVSIIMFLDYFHSNNRDMFMVIIAPSLSLSYYHYIGSVTTILIIMNMMSWSPSSWKPSSGGGGGSGHSLLILVDMCHGQVKKMGGLERVESEKEGLRSGLEQA